jgi:hypothetical protein
MDENSLEPCNPTAAKLATVLKCDAPESDNATLECCLFCVASYHFGRDALRVTVDGRTISTGKSGVKQLLGYRKI